MPSLQSGLKRGEANRESVGDAKKKPRALLVTAHGCHAQGSGILNFWIGKGNELLDALSVAIFSREGESSRSGVAWIGEGHEMVENLRVAIAGGLGKSSGIAA